MARGLDRSPVPYLIATRNRQDAFVIGLFDCLHGLGELHVRLPLFTMSQYMIQSMIQSTPRMSSEPSIPGA
jgi:hypothetical protein